MRVVTLANASELTGVRGWCRGWEHEKGQNGCTGMLGGVGGSSDPSTARVCSLPTAKAHLAPRGPPPTPGPRLPAKWPIPGNIPDHLDHLTSGKQEGQKDRGCVQNMQVVELLSHV